MTGFFIALLSGALMSVQGVFNTQVTKTTGICHLPGNVADHGKGQYCHDRRGAA